MNSLMDFFQIMVLGSTMGWVTGKFADFWFEKDPKKMDSIELGNETQKLFIALSFFVWLKNLK